MSRRGLTRWHLRDRVRVLPAGDVVVRVLVFVLGAALVALGVALVVLPGPLTIPPVLVGVYVWSLEFAFAERLLVRVTGSARSAWQAARRRPWRTGLVTGAGLVVAVLAVLLLARYGVGGAVQRVQEALR